MNEPPIGLILLVLVLMFAILFFVLNAVAKEPEKEIDLKAENEELKLRIRELERRSSIEKFRVGEDSLIGDRFGGVT